MKDSLGNIVTTDKFMLKLAIATSLTGGTQRGTVSVAGKTSFSNLLLSKADSYLLNVTDGSLVVVTSSVFAVS